MSQGDPQNLGAIAQLVLVYDQRTDAGPLLVGDAHHGRHAERGGDRRDRVDDRAGDVGLLSHSCSTLTDALMCGRSFGSNSSAGFSLLSPPLPEPPYSAAARRALSRSSRAVMALVRSAAVSPLKSKPSEARWWSSWWNAASEGIVTFGSLEL